MLWTLSATEEEAAEAYDVAAIKFRGVNAVTNFELSRYDMEAIASTELPIGGSAKRIKQTNQSNSDCQFAENNSSSAIALQTNGYATGFIRSLLELPSVAANSPVPMACLSFGGNTEANVYIPSLNWLATTNSQYDNQINCNESTTLETDPTLMELLHS